MPKLSDIYKIVEEEFAYEEKVKGDIPLLADCIKPIMSRLMRECRGGLDPNYAEEIINKVYSWTYRI